MSNFKISQARVRQIVEDKPVISQNIYDIGSIVKIENSFEDIDLPILTIDNRPNQDDGFIHLKTTRLYLNPNSLTIRANASGNKIPIFVGNLSGEADMSKYTERIQVPAISKQETDQTIKYEIVFRRDARDDVGAVGVQLSSNIYVGKDLTSIYAKRFHGIADKTDKIKADYAQKSDNDAKYEIVVKKSEPDTEGYIDVQILSKIYVNQDLDSIYATNFHGKADNAQEAEHAKKADSAKEADNADNAQEAEHAKKADKVTIENQDLGVHYYPLFVQDSNNNDNTVDGTDIKTSFGVRLPAVGNATAWHYLDVQDKYIYGSWHTEEDNYTHDFSDSKWKLAAQNEGYFSEMIVCIDYFINKEYKQIKWSYLLPKSENDDENITSLNSDLEENDINDFFIEGFVKKDGKLNKSIKITKKDNNISKWREKIILHRVGSIEPPDGHSIPEENIFNGWFEYDG